MDEAKTKSKPTVTTMSIGAVGGMVAGGLLGLIWWTPAILIPIGLVCGISVAQAVGRR
jgi:uncharacterized membrane protein